MSFNEKVRSYWEKQACGTSTSEVSSDNKFSQEWFEQVEENRYRTEPFIHSIVQFTRYHGKKILEVGVGAGTDHLQWARAGAECFGVDLTDEAIKTTKAHLELYGFNSNLQRLDAESLPFEDDLFDVVYSWGVIHHSKNPEKIIQEIRRVLKPEGKFIGMMYERYSVATYYLWVRYALAKGKPFRTLADVIWHHMESIGTQAYTISELKKMFSEFNQFDAYSLFTPGEMRMIDKWLPWCRWFIPKSRGFFIILNALK